MSRPAQIGSIGSSLAASRSRLKLAWVAPLILLPIAILGPNTALAFYACLVLGLGTMLLWRPGEPPILLLIFVYQWVQAAVGLFYGNVFGLSVDTVANYPGRDETAVFLLLTGVLVLALAMRFAAGPAIRGLLPRAQAFVAARPLKFWLLLYVAAWILSAACAWLATRAGGLRQPLLALAEVKWAAFMLLTLATFAVPGRSKLVWLAVFGFEFAVSLGGFFSSFKMVFFYALIGLVACNTRFNLRIILSAAVLAGLLVFFGLVWTAIKGDYRAFVNEGTGQQVVLADYPDRLAELVGLASRLDGEDLSRAADEMVHRVMYFDFFGAVLDYVPNIVPHADGAIWGEAMLRMFTPRLLFPDKSAVNDSELTNQYTGLGVASYEQGTSIGVGYMAEAYVDFGPVIMFVPIAALGLILGCLHRWLLVRPGPGAALGMALVPFALMPALYLESSALKVVPALGLTVIACWVVLNGLAPRLFGLRLGGRTLRMPGPARRVRA